MNFTDQIVIVTGASRGIGRGIAQAFGNAGAQVACVATTEAGAEATAETIRSAGGQAKGFACDISDSASVEALFAAVQEQIGVPSVLVNNAGITKDTLILRMKEEDWDRVIDVNLKGAFLCIRAAMKPMMKARYGRIVNISSIIGSTGQAGQANYAASKAGLFGLSKSVAKEVGSRGITCNVVCPGFIETDMTEALSPEMREGVIKTAPAGRLGAPEDIAAAVLFFASRESAYVTGQILTVDGGLTL